MGQRRVKIAGKGPALIRTTRPLNPGAKLKCIDNSGAKICELVAIRGYKGRRGRAPSAAIGDMVVVTVKSGDPELRKKPLKAIITTVRKEYRRPSGERIKFQENTCVITDDEGNPKGSEVKMAVAKEAVDRWVRLGKITRIVV